GRRRRGGTRRLRPGVGPAGGDPPARRRGIPYLPAPAPITVAALTAIRSITAGSISGRRPPAPVREPRPGRSRTRPATADRRERRRGIGGRRPSRPSSTRTSRSACAAGAGPRQASILEGQGKAPLRAGVHLSVLTVAGVHTQHVAVIAYPGGVTGWAAQSLSPIGRQPLDVLRMQARMREGVADHRVLQAAVMPGGRQPHQRLGATGRVVYAALHPPTLAVAHSLVQHRAASPGDATAPDPGAGTPAP